MIVSTHEDVVCLSGRLQANQWPAIKAVAVMLLREHPVGVVIDCREMQAISPEGIATLLEALEDIRTTPLPFAMANLPSHIETELKKATQGRFHGPLSESVESARMTRAIFSQLWWERLWGIRE